jgi:hypothetical protein
MLNFFSVNPRMGFQTFVKIYHIVSSHIVFPLNAHAYAVSGGDFHQNI